MEKCIIVISHSNYRIKSAGIEKFISDTSEQITSKGIHILHIFPVIELNKKLVGEYVGINYDGNFDGIYPESHIYDDIAELGIKKKVAFIGVDIHQLHGWDLRHLEEGLSRLNLPINIFVHDYEMVSAKALLHDNENTDSSNFQQKHQSQRYPVSCYGEANPTRFAEIENFLASISPRVEKVVAPSTIAGKNWCNCFPLFEGRMVVREHLKCVESLRKEKVAHDGIRIAYLGSKAQHKGYAFWKRLVSSFADNDNYTFFYFGKNDSNVLGVQDVHVDFQDPTCPSMTEQLHYQGIDIAFLWSTWQETYCYTYYEAFAAGCFILTNAQSGNIQFQVQSNKSGVIFQSLEQCISYLKDLDQLEKTMLDFHDVCRSFKPNPDIHDLIFENHGKKIYKRTATKHAYKSIVLSFIYKVLCGDYK